MRRECQEVLTGIWVGPTDAGKNLENLQRMGITAIVILRTASEALFLKPRFPDLFRYLILDVSDRIDQPLISIYPQLRRFIDEQKSAGGNILIHDEGGMSRAPAMAAM
jgi:serine/threonine/tyrosine-interacting protein